MPTALANDGVTISYQIQGRGPATLLFMHGWAGSGSYFDEVIGELDLSALRTITVDFRGHGDSQKLVDPYDCDRIAADVWTVADAAGVDNVILVGFSMSGKFAQHVALGRLARVSGLILVGGLPSSELPLPQAVVRDWVGRAGDRERLRELVAMFISDSVDQAAFERFLDDAVNVPAAVLECTMQTCISTTLTERVESLQMPVLIVGGKRDPIFTPETLAEVVRNLPRARGICLDCNHEIPLERPRELAHLIESFVCGLGIGCRGTVESLSGRAAHLG